ncbi:MAG: hypothetical protein WAZ77_13365 [Candidatus Nitrosopolaris sp.]
MSWSIGKYRRRASFGPDSGTIFWLTAIVGTIAAAIAGFGAVKMLEDKKDLEYKFSQR